MSKNFLPSVKKMSALPTTVAESIEYYVFPAGSTIVKITDDGRVGSHGKIFYFLEDRPFHGTLPPWSTLQVAENRRIKGNKDPSVDRAFTELYYLTEALLEYWSRRTPRPKGYALKDPNLSLDVLKRIENGGHPNQNVVDFVNYLTYDDSPNSDEKHLAKKTNAIRERLIRLYEIVNPVQGDLPHVSSLQVDNNLRIKGNKDPTVDRAFTELYYLTKAMLEYWIRRTPRPEGYDSSDPDFPLEVLTRIENGGHPNQNGVDFANYLTYDDSPDSDEHHLAKKTNAIRERLIRLYEIVNPE